MPTQNFADRLTSGQNILLDGGTGSELQRRGVNIARGWNKAGDIGPWSAVANKTAPNAVRQIHTDYLNLGADIIISNTFWGNRSRMAVAGLGATGKSTPASQWKSRWLPVTTPTRKLTSPEE